MHRFAALSRSLVVLCALFLVASVASAQITNVTNTTSTPIPGAGHDYIKALSETVNPANGSVSVRLQLPVAKGRGLTVPVSIGYDSNGFRHLKPGFYPYFGTVNWVTNTGSIGQGGWLYTFPQLNAEDWTQDVSAITGYNNQGPIYTVYPCQYDTSYLFRDGAGGVHALGLGATWVYNSADMQYCTGSSVVTGGDAQIYAKLRTNQSGNFYQPAPLTVYGADGTIYYFSSMGVGNQNDTTTFALPSYIEDRNGNIVTVSGTTFIDTAGRTLLSYTGFGPAGQTNTVTVSGLNYGVTWKSTSASYSVNPQWAGSTNGPNTSYDSCNAVPAVNDTQTVISQITLPNGTAYNFYYGNDSTPNNAPH